MRSCLAFLLTLVVLFGVIGGGAFIWYVNSTTEITRKPAPGK